MIVCWRWKLNMIYCSGFSSWSCSAVIYQKISQRLRLYGKISSCYTLGLYLRTLKQILIHVTFKTLLLPQP